MSVSALHEQLDKLIALLEGASPPNTLLPYDPQDSDAQKVFDMMGLDPAARIETLRATYVDSYGFDKKFLPDPIRGDTIREPRLGMRVEDFAAVLAVAAAMQLEPALVLALWIQEGKGAHNTALHSGKASLNVGEVTEAQYQDKALEHQIWAYERSIVLYQAFGGDRYIAHLQTDDNQPLDFTGPHEQRFRAALGQVRAQNVPGVGAWDNALQNRVIAYFRDPGGGLLHGAQVNPATGETTLLAGVAPRSLASWLWLQQALFAVYQAEEQDWFTTTYGSCPDLSDLPWVTYTHWNGKPKTTHPWFTGAADAQAAIDFRFGAPGVPPAHLPADQLAAYYAKPQAASALVSAVTLKYLCEAVGPWFA